jgi:alpha-ketoglutarate-dependent taurine dioxygenase
MQKPACAEAMFAGWRLRPLQALWTFALAQAISSSCDAGTLQITPISAALGVEVHDVNLTSAWMNEMFVEVDMLLHEHKVLLFRGQRLVPEEQLKITRKWGPVVPHPLGSRISSNLAAATPVPAEMIVLQNTMKATVDPKALRRPFVAGEARNDM